MSSHRSRTSGFTLIELMIVIAILGILAALAVPQYAAYTKSAKFTEVIVKTSGYKSGVHLCVQERNTPSGCDGGAHGVPPDIDSPQGYIESLTAADGVITATATSALDGRTYTLSPSYTASTNTLLWSIGGTCLAAGFCDD